MNKQELENKVKELESELSKLKEELNKHVSKCWKPKYRDTYYYITIYGGVSKITWTDSELDELLWAIGNCFETKEEAEFEVEKLKVIAELKHFAEEHNKPIDWKDSRQEKWNISYSYDYENIAYNFVYTIKQSDIYFSSEKIAQNAVEQIGEERVKKYYLGV